MRSFAFRLDDDLQDRLEEIGALLVFARDVRYSLTDLGYPAQDSEARRDLDSLETQFGRYAHSAYALADLWILESSHQLAAIGTLFKNADVVLGPLPLARTAMELSARAVYLLAEGVAPDQRMARAVIDQANAMSAMAKAEKRVNGPQSQLYQDLRHRQKEMRTEVGKAFGTVLEDNPDQWELKGQVFIRPTKAVHQLGEVQEQGRLFEGIYDRLSTHTHPSMGSTLFLDGDDEGGLTIPGNELEGFARWPLSAFHIALTRFATYSGWHSALKSLDAQIEEVFPDFFDV